MVLPFISRRSHEAITAEQAARIASLEAQIEYVKAMEERTRQDRIALEEKLVEALRARMTPEPSRRRRPAEEDEGVKAPETLDLSMVNPNDNEALVMIAQREIPPGTRVSGTALLRTVEKLREQVIEAHTSRMRNVATPGFVPRSIADKIADAVNAGESAAQIEVGV